MKNILLICLLNLTVFINCSANVVFAQGNTVMKGTEKPAFLDKSDTKQCYVFSQYIVKTVSGEDVGEDISIYKRGASTSSETGCKAKSALLFTIKNPDANYFIGLSGAFLFIDSGTSASARGLEIYNLNSHKSIFSSEYHDSVKLLQNRFVIYDKISAKKGVLKTCKQAAEIKRNGSTVGWVQDMNLDLQTLKETAVGALRCSAME